jgi:hypothetical protein
MIRSLSTLMGSTVQATDGEIGKALNFLFDDRTWTIRYLVVETGSWMSRHAVLIAPEAVDPPDWDKRVLTVRLTRQQVDKSPDVDTEQPVSRRHEIEMSRYYGWAAYWAMEPSFLTALPPSRADDPGQTAKADQHLFSVRDVSRYAVCCSPEELGRVEEFFVDDRSWRIVDVEVNTGNRSGKHKLLFSTSLTESIQWKPQKIVFRRCPDTLLASKAG